MLTVEDAETILSTSCSVDNAEDVAKKIAMRCHWFVSKHGSERFL